MRWATRRKGRLRQTRRRATWLRFLPLRGADISFASLQDVNDIVSDELEYIAGKGGTNDSSSRASINSMRSR